MRRIVAGLCWLSAGAAALAVPAVPALAQERGHHVFYGREVRHFHPHELVRWRGGVWRHDWFNGRYGWWWVVDGAWYFYERPLYPYPAVVSEVVVPETVVVAPPPAPVVVAPSAPVVMQAPPPVVMPSGPPPVVQPAAPPQQQTQMWYYCDNPQGYYPYVQSCSVPFRPVPAKPQ